MHVFAYTKGKGIGGFVGEREREGRVEDLFANHLH